MLLRLLDIEAKPKATMETTWYTIFDYPKAIKRSVVLAWRPIPMGARIMVEKPLLMIPRITQPGSEATTPDDSSRRSDEATGSGDIITNPVTYIVTSKVEIEAQIAALSPQQRQILSSLPQPRHKKLDPVTLVAHNLLPVGTGAAGGLFPDACRLNHSCNNNAYRLWNPNIGAYTVHALTDIDAGEEITITYMRTQDANSRSRAMYLMKMHAFVCTCWLCTMPEADREKMDYTFDGLGRLGNLYKDKDRGSGRGSTERAERRLRHLRQKVNVHAEMNLWDVRLMQPFEAAFGILVRHGDAARASVFATRVVRLYTLRVGADHPETERAEHQRKDIIKNAEYGRHSMAWQTSESDVPEDLGQADFEDWLWRQSTKVEGQLVSMGKNRTFFPPFGQLPNKTDLDPVYYTWNGSEKTGRKHHWCFLGWITGTDVCGKENLILTEDVDGEEVPLGVAWDVDLGGEDNPKTVAVLYAEQQWLHPELWGIRVTDPGVFKVREAFHPPPSMCLFMLTRNALGARPSMPLSKTCWLRPSMLNSARRRRTASRDATAATRRGLRCGARAVRTFGTVTR